MGGRTIIPQGTFTDSGHPAISMHFGRTAARYAGASLKACEQAALIYLVEDDPDICDALEFMLTANGFEVVVCHSGTALLNQVDLAAASNVLMDLRLPDVDGLDLLVKLRAQAPALPVIVMTGFGQVQMAVRAMKLGALDFLEKPIDESELLSLLRRRPETNVTPRMDVHAVGLLADLTAREVETLSKLVKGLTSKQAAQELGISHRTVDVHRASILQKLGAPTTMAALAMVRQIEPVQYQLLIEDPAQFFSVSQRKALRSLAG